MAKNDNLQDFITDLSEGIKQKKGYPSTQKINPQNFRSEILSIETGSDTSDATATYSDILKNKTAYAQGAKLTGTIETYDGTYVTSTTAWQATVSNLGSDNPSSVVFDVPANTVKKPWSNVTFNGDEFIKFNKMYKKIITVTDNQITSFTIADRKLDNNYEIYPCFLDESGNELDYILVGKYMSKSSTTCNSVASGSVVNQTLENARANAKARGSSYQLMDWRIHRLWQDLIICVMKTVNTNSGSGITTDALGLYWGTDNQWVDGFSHNGTTWLYSNSPSKYIDSPTATTDGYAALSGYFVPAVGNVEVKTLGYDSTQPFFNYPSGTVSNSSYNTYYCDVYYYGSGNLPINIRVGNTSAFYGVFCCVNNINWTDSLGVRLCYRPVAS